MSGERGAGTEPLLVGRVLTPDGQPAVGADLRVGRGVIRAEGFQTHDEHGIRFVRTDDRGRFVLEPLPGQFRDIWATLAVYVTHASGVEQVEDLRLADEAVDLGDITLHPPYRVTVQLTDEHGAPVRGASVTSYATPPADHGGARADYWHVSAESDAGGWARLPAIARHRGAHVELSVVHPDFVTIGLETRLDGSEDADESLEVVLSRGRAVTGHVLDGARQPVAGYRIARRTPHSYVAGDRTLIVTDEDGGFTVEGVTRDETRLDVFSPPDPELGEQERSHPFSPARAVVQVPAGGDADIGDVVLPQVSEVRGRVLDPSGRAVVRGSAFISRDDGFSGSYSQSRRLTRAGRFRFTHVLPGPHRIGLRAFDRDGEEWMRYDFPVMSPVAEDVQVTTAAGGHVTLQLLDAREPHDTLEVEDAVLVFGESRLTSSGPMTSFRVLLTPWTYETFRFRAKGYAWCDLGPVVVPESHAIELDVHLEREKEPDEAGS